MATRKYSNTENGYGKLSCGRLIFLKAVPTPVTCRLKKSKREKRNSSNDQHKDIPHNTFGYQAHHPVEAGPVTTFQVHRNGFLRMRSRSNVVNTGKARLGAHPPINCCVKKTPRT